MTRWTIFLVAIVIVACSEGKRDEVYRNGADTVVGADTGLRTNPGDTDTEAAGVADTASGARTAAPGGTGVAQTKPAPSPARSRSPTAAARAESATGAASGTGPTGAEAMGGVRGARTLTPRDLSAAQVRRLQAALNILGCNAGDPDGVLGQRTQEAVACGLKKKKLGRNDFSGLYRSLNLNF